MKTRTLEFSETLAHWLDVFSILEDDAVTTYGSKKKPNKKKTKGLNVGYTDFFNEEVTGSQSVY